MDELDRMAEIPTCNIMGAKDAYLLWSIALFDICDENQGRLLNHGRYIPFQGFQSMQQLLRGWKGLLGM